MALLQQSAPQNPAQTDGRPAPVTGAADKGSADKPQFEEASIRPCDPDNLPRAFPEGRGGGSGNTFQSTPGRTHALCVTLATLIRTAYGSRASDPDFLGGRGNFNAVYRLGVEDDIRVRGGPNWVRSERYTIDAVADTAADAETMRGPMLRALLEQRLRLKAHIEAEQIPAFELTVAGGLKLRPVGSGAAYQSARCQDTSPVVLPMFAAARSRPADSSGSATARTL